MALTDISRRSFEIFVTWMEELAKFTPTPIDDHIARFLRAVASSPAIFEWIKSLLGVLPPDANPEEARYSAPMPQHVLDEFAKHGVSEGDARNRIPAALAMMRRVR